MRERLGFRVQLWLLVLLLLLSGCVALVDGGVLVLHLPEEPVPALAREHPVDQIVAAVVPQVLTETE